MPLKKIFTLLSFICFIYLFSFAQEKDKESGLSGSDLNDKLSDPQVNFVLLTYDINSDGVDEVFTVSLIKKINKDFFWISRGAIHENIGGKKNVLLYMGDKLLSSDGTELINQMPADNGYIVSYEINPKGFLLYISLADKNGKSFSDELQLKWNAKTKQFEILNF